MPGIVATPIAYNDALPCVPMSAVTCMGCSESVARSPASRRAGSLVLNLPRVLLCSMPQVGSGQGPRLPRAQGSATRADGMWVS